MKTKTKDEYDDDDDDDNNGSVNNTIIPFIYPEQKVSVVDVLRAFVFHLFK